MHGAKSSLILLTGNILKQNVFTFLSAGYDVGLSPSRNFYSESLFVAAVRHVAYA